MEENKENTEITEDTEEKKSFEEPTEQQPDECVNNDALDNPESPKDASDITNEDNEEKLYSKERIEKLEKALNRLIEEKEEEDKERYKRSEVEKTARLFSNDKTEEDILSGFSDRETRSLIEKGYSPSNAYLITHLSELLDSRYESGRKTAINEILGKAHMQSVKGEFSNADIAPEEISAEYRLFDKDLTQSEINRHYRKYLKSLKDD